MTISADSERPMPVQLSPIQNTQSFFINKVQVTLQEWVRISIYIKNCSTSDWDKLDSNKQELLTMRERICRHIAFPYHVSRRLIYSDRCWKEKLAFKEVDCIGEPMDPSFAIGWPSFAFKVPLDNPLNLWGSVSPYIGELPRLPCAKSCCWGKSWNWFEFWRKGFWTCAPKPGRIWSMPWTFWQMP